MDQLGVLVRALLPGASLVPELVVAPRALGVLEVQSYTRKAEPVTV